MTAREWVPEEIAYSAWLTAARQASNSPVAVVRRMQRYLSDEAMLIGLHHNWDPASQEKKNSGWESTTYMQWEKGRKSSPYPSVPEVDAVRRALVVVVTKVVPKPPAASGSAVAFSDVVKALRNRRKSSQATKGEAAKKDGAALNTVTTRSFFAADPVPAAELDAVALGLGSALFDNELPPYIPRTADMELAALLRDPTARLTVVVGAPKSGKSRSVLHHIQEHRSTDLTWWVNPAPQVLPRVLSRIGATDTKTRPKLIVLDDAHLHGVNPADGLTVARLSELSRNSRVIVILHEKDLASWQHHASNRSSDLDRSAIGASRELVDLLSTHQIYYPSVLDDVELEDAAASYDEALQPTDALDLTRMAEAFASVDALHKKAIEALKAGGITAAIVDAAIDASIAFPAGIDLSWFEKFTRARYRIEEPNKTWKPALFEEALDWITTGIAPRSPHAVMTLTAQDTHRLLDALTPKLRTRGRNLDHLHDLILPPQALGDVGYWYFASSNITDAKSWCLKAADAGLAVAIFNLGVLALDEGDEETAIDWFTRGVDAGSADAMFALGFCANTSGDIDGAICWYTRAGKAGHAGAMDSMGFLAKEAGDLKAAIHWYTLSAGLGSAGAMVQLGVLAANEGDLEGAVRWYTQAADAGGADAMYNLGLLAHQAGNPEEAIVWYKRPADAGDAVAMFNLGNYAIDAGDPEDAVGWFTRAADSGRLSRILQLGSFVRLSILAKEAGDTIGEVRWVKRAAEAGYVNAMLYLSNLAHKAEDPEEAAHWLRRAADAGNANAMFDLGLSARVSRDLTGARHWFGLAAAKGHEDAKAALEELRPDDSDM